MRSYAMQKKTGKGRFSSLFQVELTTFLRLIDFQYNAREFQMFSCISATWQNFDVFEYNLVKLIFQA